MTDENSREGGRRGRRPKDQKRIPLSVRLIPEKRQRLVEMATENSLSITQQIESLIDHSPTGPHRCASAPSPELRRTPRPKRSSDDAEHWAELEDVFGRQIAGLLLTIGQVMFLAAKCSLAWSRDVVERTQRFRAVTADEGSTFLQMKELHAFLLQSMPSDEQSWLSQDPYVFQQVADATRLVLETVAPEENLSDVPPPRGINPVVATLIMKTFGEGAAEEVFRDLIANEEIDQTMLCIREWLGEAVTARVKQRVLIEPAATSGQNASPRIQIVRHCLRRGRSSPPQTKSARKR